MTTDISLSTNPVISFLYKWKASEPFKVTVIDSSNASLTMDFDPPPKGRQMQRREHSAGSRRPHLQLPGCAAPEIPRIRAVLDHPAAHSGG